jgi:ABC-type Zn uptake system ZnuABC Zn-binding protein ZnuA
MFHRTHTEITDHKRFWLAFILATLVISLLLIAGCSSPQDQPASTQTTEQHEEAHDGEILALPELEPVDLSGERLKVVATTSIIGDVVSQVGGDAIELTTLMDAGENPHSYEPAAQDLTAVAIADIIFVNGWNLEETLVDDLGNIGENAIFVPVSANIKPMEFGNHDEGAGDEHVHSGPDPHTWFSIHNVDQWTENIATTLASADPAHTETYEANANAYLTQLQALDADVKEKMAGIPTENRMLITNHSALGYLASDYDLEILGTVIPGMSTLAEPSASNLVDLIGTMEAHGICTIFTETTVSDSLAQTVAAELSNCDEVQVLPLYTGALGPTGSGADSYIGMFRANIDTILEGLR